MSDIDPTGQVAAWWSTSIIDMEPGHIRIRGTPIQDLIGTLGFVEMIWLMTRGTRPSQGEAQLLEAALVAGVDHGPQAPSIAAARMAASCGIGINSVMATGINMLGDVHGGAGEQSATLYLDIAARMGDGADLGDATEAGLKAWRATNGPIIPGFGHRFHKPEDPRAPKLMDLTREAAKSGICDGVFAQIAEEIQASIARLRGEPIAMNIDGATAVIFCELGFAPELVRGLFCLSRSVGILSHGFEEACSGSRNKGPIPRALLPRYTGE